MTAVSALLLALITGWMVPAARLAMAAFLGPWLVALIYQTADIGLGYAVSPPQTVTQFPRVIGYVVVTAVILALGLILSALIGERRSRVVPVAGRQTAREMVTRAALAGTVVVAALIVLDIADHAVLVWPESTAHHTTNPSPPLFGILSIALCLIGIAVLGTMRRCGAGPLRGWAIRKRGRQVMPDGGAGGKPGQPGSGVSPDEPGLVGQDDCLHSVPQFQLGQDVPHVSLDGAFLHDKPFGDLGIRQALGDQPEHVEFPASQLAEYRGHRARGPDGASEAADQTPGGERVDKRASSDDSTNRLDELRLRRVLEEEPARPALQRPVDVLVVVEGGQHQHAGGPGPLEDPPGRFQAVQHRHPDIHQHHTGTKARDDADRLQPVRRLADHPHSRFMVKDDADAVADKALVICDHDRDQVCLGHRSERTVRAVSAAKPGVLPSAGRAWAATGIVLAAGLSAFAAVLVLGITHTGHPHGGVAAAAGVLAMTVPIAWAYRAPTLTLAVLLAAAVLNGLIFGSMVRCGGTLPALLYATACAGARPWTRRTALSIVLALMAAVAQAFSDPNLGPGFLIFGVPAILAFCVVGRLAGQRLEAIADLRRRNAGPSRAAERTAALSITWWKKTCDRCPGCAAPAQSRPDLRCGQERPPRHGFSR